MNGLDGATLFSLRLSLQVALTATCFVIIVGMAVAYVLARCDFRGRQLLDILCTLPLVLPPSVTGYYLILLFGRNGIPGRWLYELTGESIMFTWQAAALASFVVSLPLMVKTTRAAIESVDVNLVRASYSLGRTERETLFSVILPLAKPGIIAGALLSFCRAMGEFGATLMIAGNIPGRTDTMPLAIYTSAASGDWGRAHFMVAVFTVVSGGLLLLANHLSSRFRKCGRNGLSPF
ncbi:MAG: molybdate ABC transporter permease subunit [Deltaproteobacteria bacterium]|nr:molybdate ABC transporter permease subunit [Deltaproteobacteria bacterium]